MSESILPTRRSLALAWATVALLWLAGGSNYLTRTMLTTMRGSVIEEIPMTEAQFGLLTSGFLVFYAAASPFGGFLADRFSRRRVVLWSIFSWSAITWITAYARTLEVFLVLRCLLGLSQAFYIPAAVALIVDYHRGSTRALATGIHLTGMIVGAVIGGVGGWLAEKHGWSYAYTTIGLPNLALGILLYLFLRDSPREPVGQSVTGAPPEIRLGDAVRSLTKPGAFYYVAACMGVQGGVSWIIIGWMPTVMREQFQMAQGEAGFSTLGCLYVAQAIGLLSGGFWSDRQSASNPRARIIIPAVAILLTTPLFLLTGWFHHIGFTIVSLAAWGLAMGFLGANTMPMVCLVVDARYRATAIGVLNGLTSICGSLAIYGVGALRDAKVGVSLILTFAAIGVFLCGSLLWLANLAVKKNGPVPSSGQ
ncbi:Sugar phosphate permease [Opitutus sp. GAS368]|nr:Sugar phosphate permease [Opitutus sp. GAS368]